MKILKVILIVIGIFVLFGGAGYLYASSGVSSHPGYVSLVKPKGPSVNTIVSLKLGPGGVGPVRWLAEQLTSDTDHEHDVAEQLLKTVLDDLQGMQLRVYDVSGNREVYDTAIAESIAALKAKQWEALAIVREDNEYVSIMQLSSDEQIMGLSIMASTPDAAVFMNLVGPFDPMVIAQAVSAAR